MRTKKALINSGFNIISFIIIFLPNLIIRKVFLNTLGSDMLGLNSLYSNIIGWLSIFELGVGTAIIYSLYKPYANNDYKQVRAYIQFYGTIYRTVGIIILIIGIIISPFLKFFIEGNINSTIVTMGFLFFLINSFISYLFSHKICILNVAQESYKVTIATMISKLVIIILQLIMFKIYASFIIFIVIQIVINVIYFIGINLYINFKFPWLRYGNEKLDEEVKKSLLKNIRAMFMHKIGAVIVNSTDSIVISKFVGLIDLAKYSNYQMIISAMQTIVNNGLNGITASIGNMLSTENTEKSYDVHKKIFFLNFWIVSFIVISLYNTLNQFIAIIFGDRYLLDNITFIVILINIYFSLMRGSLEQFQSGSGNFYKDRYAPICEAIINICASIILVNYIGIAGVFIGTLISNLTVIFWTKPYVVYKYVFEKPINQYFKMYFKYLIIASITLSIVSILSYKFKYNYSFYSFFINCIINILTINILYLIIFFRTSEFKYFKNLIKKLS